MQKALILEVTDKSVAAKEKALCARAWIDLERMKREIRGVPPLAPHKAHELMRRQKRIPSQTIDIEPSEDSPKPEPVPAPPTPEWAA
jgi:hypothetical protein